MINCPNCNGEKFEVHLVGGLEMKAEMPEMVNVAKFFTCVECEYVIAQPSDLNLMTITIYVLGNSISKQRQGFQTINKQEDAPSPHMFSPHMNTDILTTVKAHISQIFIVFY